VSSGEECITKEHAHEKNWEVPKLHGDHPWYAQELLWGLDEEEIGPTALYSLTVDPLPRLPLSAFQTKATMKTLLVNPKLFKITCLIDVDVFEELLLNHPNPLFCRSIFNGLCMVSGPGQTEQMNILRHSTICFSPQIMTNRRTFSLLKSNLRRVQVCCLHPLALICFQGCTVLQFMLCLNPPQRNFAWW
jgi:hypothetical protein